ncbi:histidine phosphatase family protein [Telmatospirillum sp.]|uniref:histidine phosphatase family protein n=1 Tax=Telmatospirillum sp. TaxID=2079197 RepID=UPI0028440DFB|nr:histidine phosphatase family protein [Telmatospirillum sp.]MDR3439691.1 histidine phosphatase family protein [Telmatospirillum sp.]
MDILFARHGNTFNPGDKVVWVGRETDLPLVDKGLAQARAAADALERTGLIPDVIVTASLARTRRFAEIVADALKLAPPKVDVRLDELDYGRWAGRTNDEIAAEGPAAVDAMAAWSRHDQWPSDAGWRSQEAAVLADVAQFAADVLADGGHARPLIVSSNGILRFLPRALLPRQSLRDSFKMRTGHLGRIERVGTQSVLRCWDVAPADFA